jgi:hypothetical protein
MADKVRYPRVGSFEIYYDKKQIYSKLEIGQWPSAAAIAHKIKDTKETLKLPPLAPASLPPTNRRRRIKKVKRVRRGDKSTVTALNSTSPNSTGQNRTLFDGS